ncbi:hypothetical protein BHM03_00025548 [Ensete ventricosum]|nr:hypothetical protein BHM03_00025548 [Ensete ventricosum]
MNPPQIPQAQAKVAEEGARDLLLELDFSEQITKRTERLEKRKNNPRRSSERLRQNHQEKDLEMGLTRELELEGIDFQQLSGTHLGSASKYPPTGQSETRERTKSERVKESEELEGCRSRNPWGRRVDDEDGRGGGGNGGR